MKQDPPDALRFFQGWRLRYHRVMNERPDMPIYAFIKRELKNQIESGELPEGARVPSEFELARQYGVSRNPTRQALRDLELEGYLVRTPGRGSFVTPKTQWQKLFNVNGWRAVAIACPELEFHYTRTVIRGFVERAAEESYLAMVYFIRFSGESEFQFLADMRNSGIQGMAFWLQHASDRVLDLLRKFQRSGFPFVLIDRYVRGLESDFVVTDNEDAAYRLTRALLERGHKDIGLVTSALDNTSAEDRLAGHQRALREAGIRFSEELLGVFDMEDESNSAVVHRIMAHRRHPTAFLCNNDGIAATLLDELNALEFSVPDDVEVATLDDNELAAALDVPLITASQQAYEMGRASAEILIHRIADASSPPQQRFLKAVMNPAPGRGIS